jgi:hypothetical protein
MIKKAIRVRLKGLQRGKSDAGFSVVELALTIAVIAIFLGLFYLLFNTINTVSKRGLDLVVSSDHAYAKLQEYENKPWASLPTVSTSSAENFAGQLNAILFAPKTADVYVTCTDGTASCGTPTIKKVRVVVTYYPSQSVEYSTYIQQIGAGK